MRKSRPVSKKVETSSQPLPAPSFSGINNAGRLSRVLSILILCLGVCTAVFTAILVCQTYSPVPWFDQWSFVDTLKRAGGTLRFSQLWEQHGEHNVAIGLICGFVDLRFFGGRNVSLLIEVYVVQACVAFLLIWMAYRFGRLRGSALFTTAGFSLFCALCPNQMENFGWGFQIAFVFCGLAVAASFAGLIYHQRAFAIDKRRWISWWLILSLIAAFLPQWCLASGLLVWPLLAILAFSLRFPTRTQFVIVAAGTVA